MTVAGVRHWQRFAADCGLNATRLVQRVEALAKNVLNHTRAAAADVAAMPAGPHPLMEQVCAAIETRAQALLSGLADETGIERPEDSGITKPRKRRKALGSMRTS